MGNLGIGGFESGDLGNAPISPKSPKNSILSTVFERYDAIMTKEQLTSEGMSSKIRKAIGYIKTPDEDYEDKYLTINEHK